MPTKNGDSHPSEVQVPLSPAPPLASQNKLEYASNGMQAEPTAGVWLDNKPHIQVPKFFYVEEIAEGTG